jgi:hypothetical protein
MLALHETIVAGEQDDCVPGLPRAFDPRDQAAEAFIDGGQRPHIVALPARRVPCRMIGKFHAMPAVALVALPARGEGGIRRGFHDRGREVRIKPMVARGRFERCMRGLVREIQEIGLVRVAPVGEPVERIIGELVRDVARLRHGRAIDVEEARTPEDIARTVIALSRKADPAVEPGARRGAVAAHVPFSDQGGLITCALQPLGEQLGACGQRHIVVDDAVTTHRPPGEQRRPARRTQRGRHERIPEPYAFARQPVHVRGLQLGPYDPQRIEALIVGDDDDDVGAAGVLSARRRRDAEREQCG